MAEKQNFKELEPAESDRKTIEFNQAENAMSILW